MCTVIRGTGVFAGEHISANTFIGIYAGEFLTDAEGDRRGKYGNPDVRCLSTPTEEIFADYTISLVKHICLTWTSGT